MHVISKKKLQEFAQKHPERKVALDVWYKLLDKGSFTNFEELKATFPSVDKVGRFTVFDVAGNHVRVIGDVVYRSRTVFIKYVLTHADYTKIKLD